MKQYNKGDEIYGITESDESLKITIVIGTIVSRFEDEKDIIYNIRTVNRLYGVSQNNIFDNKKDLINRIKELI